MRRAVRELVGLVLEKPAGTAFVSGNGPAHLVKLMADHGRGEKGEQVALYGCWSFAHLLESQPSLGGEVAAAGGPAEILASMAAHKASSGVQTYGCAALEMTLSTSDPGGGVVDAAKRIFSTHPKDGTAVLHAIRLLHAVQLSPHSAKYRDTIQDSQIVQFLNWTKQAFPADSPVAMAATSAQRDIPT